MLEALGGEIVAWEAEPSDRARLDEIFRFVHTVKGNCGFFDLPRLEALSHAAEDVLAEVRAGTRVADRALVSAVLAVIDRIGELVQALDSGEALASDDDERSDRRARRVDGRGQAAASKTPSLGLADRKALRSIRLSVDLLDRMMSGVSDMVLARNELARRPARNAARRRGRGRVRARLGAASPKCATRSPAPACSGSTACSSALPRMVRDLSAELGKQVALEVDGGDVELDREMIEMIRDPLTHIVRNAIDHGIEAPKTGPRPARTRRARCASRRARPATRS